MNKIVNKVIYGLHAIYLITGAMDYSSLELGYLGPDALHAMYTNAFIAYAIGYLLFELLPKLAKSAWALCKKMWSVLR